MTPHKKLIKKSEDYLVLVNSKDFLDLQRKFDNKCEKLQNELKALSSYVKKYVNNDSELKQHNEKAIKQTISIENIDNDIQNLDKIIKKFNKNHIQDKNQHFKSLQ